MSAAVHSVEAGLDDVSDFERERGIVSDDGIVGRCDEVRMAVRVLQAFTRERCLPRGCSDNESSDHLVAREPHLVARSLKTKHRIQNVNRNHRLALCCVRSSRCDKGRHRTGFVDTGVNDLAGNAFLVGEELLAVYRGVVVSGRVVDLGGWEVRVHPESSGFVRNDRDKPGTPVFVAQQVFEQSCEGHGGRNSLLATALFAQLEVLVVDRG